MWIHFLVVTQSGRWTHVGDDGDEGVGDGEGEALRRSRLEAFLHQGEAVLPAEQTDVAQQMQRHLHVLVSEGEHQMWPIHDFKTDPWSHTHLYSFLYFQEGGGALSEFLIHHLPLIIVIINKCF